MSNLEEDIYPSNTKASRCVEVLGLYTGDEQRAGVEGEGRETAVRP